MSSEIAALSFRLAAEWGAIVKCAVCGDVISALNPCDRACCIEAAERMATASARLDASFKATPIPDHLIPRGIWGISERDETNEAEAMRRQEL